MVVAMVSVRVMQVSVNQIVLVVAMRNRLMAASGPVYVGDIMTTATMLGGAPVGID